MQRLKKAIRRIAAIGVGAAMIGATITSAVAIDLSEYPAPFIVNGEFDTSNAIVVGESAASSDTLGAIDIAAQMQFDAKKAVSTGGGTVSVTGGVTEDIPLDLGIANSTTIALDWELDDGDISSFQDTSIMFQGEDYDVHDELVLSTEFDGGPSIETSLTGSDDDYEANVFMHMGRKGVYYAYAFDDAIKPNNATTTEPLSIKFLGKTLKITKVDTSKTIYTNAGQKASKFTAYVGNEYFMKVGDSVTVEGKKVTLSNVGSGGSIVIDVDGTLETIPIDTTETVNGVEISNDETFYEDTKSERSAHLIIGKDAQGTYEDGEAYIGEDESDPNWKWFIKNLYVDTAYSTTINRTMNGPGSVIGIYNEKIYNDDTDNPPGVGECFDLPNTYASICLDSLTVPDTDYMTVTIEYSSNEDTSASNYALGSATARVIKITAENDDAFIIPRGSMQALNGTLNNNEIKTKKVYLQLQQTDALATESILVYYYDKEKIPTLQYIGNLTALGGAKSSQGFLRLNYKDTKDDNIFMNISNWRFNAITGEYVLEIDINGDSTSELINNRDNIFINFSNGSSGWNALGTGSSEEDDELQWSLTGIQQLGKKDEDHRTAYGIIIKDPKSNGASNKVVLEIPGDQVQANVVVKGQATAVSGGATSYVSTKIDVNPMMDTEVTDPTAHNLILVGGPAVNSIVKDLIGAEWKYASGEALIKLMTNGSKVALIVAGTDAIDTRMACKVIANYKDYNLETTEQVVTGTISAPTIKTA